MYKITLKKLRGNVPLVEVALQLGISKSYLSLIENGNRRMSLEIASKLSRLYCISIDEIYLAYQVCRMSTSKEVSNNLIGISSSS